MTRRTLLPWGGTPHIPEMLPLRDLHKRVDQVFDTMFHRLNGEVAAPFGTWEQAFDMPKLDVAEGKKAYTVTVELPGVEEGDLDITINEGLLTIKGEKNAETKEEEENYHRVERTYGAFQRAIALPENVKAAEIEAAFDKGVLTITIPKARITPPKAQKITLKKGKQ